MERPNTTAFALRTRATRVVWKDTGVREVDRSGATPPGPLHALVVRWSNEPPVAVVALLPELIFPRRQRMDDGFSANSVPPKRGSFGRLSLPTDDVKDQDQEGDQLSIMSDNDEDMSLGLELDETSDHSNLPMPIYINVTRTSPIPPELRPNGHAGNGE
uniref:Uncharacterized protein n=1 Tax=Plectus sambesii TaxID=2011161 RepID=A0A914UPX4_9BILA